MLLNVDPTFLTRKDKTDYLGTFLEDKIETQREETARRIIKNVNYNNRKCLNLLLKNYIYEYSHVYGLENEKPLQIVVASTFGSVPLGYRKINENDYILMDGLERWQYDTLIALGYDVVLKRSPTYLENDFFYMFLVTNPKAKINVSYIYDSEFKREGYVYIPYFSLSVSNIQEKLKFPDSFQWSYFNPNNELSYISSNDKFLTINRTLEYKPEYPHYHYANFLYSVNDRGYVLRYKRNLVNYTAYCFPIEFLGLENLGWDFYYGKDVKHVLITINDIEMEQLEEKNKICCFSSFCK